MTARAEELARGIAREFRAHVVQEYVPRIGRCVELLSEEQLWHRPGPHGNSVGNLLLHLAGNTRQWILAGIGGQADSRDRDGEFAAERGEGTPPPGEMMDLLRMTVDEAAIIEPHPRAPDGVGLAIESVGDGLQLWPGLAHGQDQIAWAKDLDGLRPVGGEHLGAFDERVAPREAVAGEGTATTEAAAGTPCETPSDATDTRQQTGCVHGAGHAPIDA